MEEPPALIQVVDGVVIIELLYMIVLGTFVTQLLFTFGLKYATASQAGVIFPLESVSATLFGCVFLGEQLDWVYIVGGLLLIGAIIISSVEFPKKEKRLE
jgi:drug/metabolite transporter (DMT)-like permease